MLEHDSTNWATFSAPNSPITKNITTESVFQKWYRLFQSRKLGSPAESNQSAPFPISRPSLDYTFCVINSIWWVLCSSQLLGLAQLHILCKKLAWGSHLTVQCICHIQSPGVDKVTNSLCWFSMMSPGDTNFPMQFPTSRLGSGCTSWVLIQTHQKFHQKTSRSDPSSWAKWQDTKSTHKKQGTILTTLNTLKNRSIHSPS